MNNSVVPMNAEELEAFRQRHDTREGIWWEMSAEEVARAYAAGWRMFDRADLRRADLYGANLYKADLRGADLRRADLYGANLYKADLRRADLYGANLYKADLRGADLYGAYLYGADLRGADLYGADLRGAISVAFAHIYVAYAPGMSSRSDSLYGGVDDNDNLIFWAGCQERVTASYLRERINEIHDGNYHAVQYEAAIQFIEACYQSDVKRGWFAEMKRRREAKATEEAESKGK